MPPAKDDVLLIGPAVISPWRKLGEASVSQAEQQAFVGEIFKRVRQECPHLVFENDYYIICAID